MVVFLPDGAGIMVGELNPSSHLEAMAATACVVADRFHKCEAAGRRWSRQATGDRDR
jgi:hypothetical protein